MTQLDQPWGVLLSVNVYYHKETLGEHHFFVVYLAPDGEHTARQEAENRLYNLLDSRSASAFEVVACTIVPNPEIHR